MAHRLALLIFPDFQILDVAGPLAAFEIAERVRPGSYAWRLVASSPGPVMCSAAVPWPAGPLPRAGSFDTLLLAGGDGVDGAREDAPLQRFLKRTAAGPARIASICSGSLLLAEAGLLDGRAATTHWSRTREFRRRYPLVRLDADRIFVRDGRLWSSAGISAGIDLALALIAADLGEAVARRVAQHLVVYYRRPGGQSQFSEMLAIERSDGRFAGLLDQVRSRLDQRHGVADLAERACMSPRHFARAFHAETGVTPAHAVERLRVEAARAALESGAASVQKVALACGFGNPERMRRSFIRLLGTPPSALRMKRLPTSNRRASGS